MFQGFYYRLGGLCLMMLSIVLFVAVLALLPPYLFSNAKSKIASQKLEIQTRESVPLDMEEINQVLTDVKGKLNLVEKNEQNRFIVSEQVIRAILKDKVSGIKILSMAYRVDQNNGKEITLSGDASSRQALLNFRQKLESDPAFKKVDLPISNFVRGTNIRFYLTLSPA